MCSNGQAEIIHPGSAQLLPGSIADPTYYPPNPRTIIARPEKRSTNIGTNEPSCRNPHYRCAATVLRDNGLPYFHWIGHESAQAIVTYWRLAQATPIIANGGLIVNSRPRPANSGPGNRCPGSVAPVTGETTSNDEDAEKAEKQKKKRTRKRNKNKQGNQEQYCAHNGEPSQEMELRGG